MIWNSLVALILAGLLALPGMPPAQAGGTTVQEEVRAVWVATVYNLDYPARGTTDAGALRREADEILQGCAEMGMNWVILQVRPTCDALYPSDLFPWSRYLTGRQGSAPSGGFDPLAYWVERAHALGLELHAWINPYRVTRGGQGDYDTLAPNSPALLHPDWVVEHDGNYYLDPGLPQVEELVLQGAEELARRYDIDGVHLDDYFYPGSDFDDAATFARYGGGFSDLGDWRRDNVNRLVKKLGERLHAIDPELSYGISPSGVWADRSSLPEGSATTGGYESYYASYADSRKWVQEGWIDYICPQIYWYIGHRTMDYATIARWWAGTVAGTGVSLYVGMADYQAGKSDPGDPWYGTQAIQDQLDLNDTLPQVAGEVHFRYRLIAANEALRALYRQRYAAPTAPPQPTPVPTPTPVFTPSPAPTPLPASSPAPAGPVSLNREEHFAYLQGDGGQVRPDDTLSRAEAVSLLARLSVDGAGNRVDLTAPGTGGFSDVPGDAWYAPAVAFAQAYGITNGYLDGTFRPGAPVSRAELVKLLSAYFDLTGAGRETGFPDVPEDHWAAQAVAYGAAQGWVSGYLDGTFQPDRPVSRAEAVKLLNRALGRACDPEFPVEAPFSDVPAGHWAYGEILEASVSHSFARDGETERWIGEIPK